MKIGVLGGGQLGRMLALAGYPLGLEFRFLDRHEQVPAAPLADSLVGDFLNADLLAEFSKDLDVCTYEFENVPVESVRKLTGRLQVYPPAAALEVAQDRFLEKSLFRKLGLNTPSFATIDGPSDHAKAIDTVGMPAVLKTRRMGYDGKGQYRLSHADELSDACQQLGGKDLILESWVPFQREISLVGVRDQAKNVRFYPPIENIHAKGILRVSCAPAFDVDDVKISHARSAMTRIMESLNYVGVLAVEFFETENDLLGNEMAPRVHNSGHWSIEGAHSSQFENHVRAVAGLPLGSTEMVNPALMFNIIGSRPNLSELLDLPGVHLHWYGKTPEPGRKLGHATVVASSLVSPNFLDQLSDLTSAGVELGPRWPMIRAKFLDYCDRS